MTARLAALVCLVPALALAAMTPAPAVEHKCWYITETADGYTFTTTPKTETHVLCTVVKFRALEDEYDALRSRYEVSLATMEHTTATGRAEVERCELERDACQASSREPDTDVRGYALVGLAGVVVGIVLAWWAR